MNCKSTVCYIYRLYINLLDHTQCGNVIQTFMGFCFRLLEQGQHSDVKFLVHGQTFPAHRCVLSARSEYFTEMFETKWKGKNLITLKHPLVDTYIFRLNHSVLLYIVFFVIRLSCLLHSTKQPYCIMCIRAVLISDQPCSLWSHPAVFLYRLVCVQATNIQFVDQSF